MSKNNNADTFHEDKIYNIYDENIYIKIKHLNKELLDYIQKNELLLEQIEKIQKENLTLKKKYKSLSESKAGKATLKYWKLKNKLSRR